MGMGGARAAGGEAKSQSGPGRGCTAARCAALHCTGCAHGALAVGAVGAPRWSGREINVKHPTPPAASPLPCCPALLHARPWACFERPRQGQGVQPSRAWYRHVLLVVVIIPLQS